MKERTAQKAFHACSLVLIALFCLLPIVFMFAVGFSLEPGFLEPAVRFRPTFRHIAAVLTQSNLHFLDYLKNSLIVSLSSAGLSVLVASLAAYAMTRLPLPGKIVILFCILAASLFPQISLMSYLFKFMTRLGWINTYPALVFPYLAWILPFSLWILVSYFAQLPPDLDEAALVDGCSRLQILWLVIFPVAAPGIFSTLLLDFIFAFNEFLFALMLTTDHAARTVPVGIALFQGLHGEVPWGTIMAAAVITTLPLIALAFSFQKQIIQGLTGGAVKG